jgi:hypothetical protein
VAAIVSDQRDPWEQFQQAYAEYILNYGKTEHWWFAVYADEGRRGCDSLYNTAENMRGIRLTTGKMARAAAECVMEVLRRTADMTDKGSAP